MDLCRKARTQSRGLKTALTIQTLLGAANSSTALSTLGVSSFGQSLIDDTSASNALTTLGVSTFAKTLLDDSTAAVARVTLDVPSNADLAAIRKFEPRNILDNGDFFWQRIATSSTGDAMSPFDRWYNGHTGSSKTVTAQPFTQGQTAVPGNPEQFSRTVITSVAGANNRTFMRQPLENANTLAGKTATLTFYAKADAARPIAVEFVQFFGTGTGVSAPVTGIGVTKFTLSTSWQKCQVIVNLPSVSGKAFNTNQQDSLDLNIWFEAGSSYNARTLSLGQQSGTFDIAHVSLVDGDASAEADPFLAKAPAEEYAHLMAYYQFYNQVVGSGYGPANQLVYFNMIFAQPMRVTPSASFYSTSYSNASAVATLGTYTTNHNIQFKITALGAAWCQTGVEYYANFFGYN